jgi:hypothetical protein
MAAAGIALVALPVRTPPGWRQVAAGETVEPLLVPAAYAAGLVRVSRTDRPDKCCGRPARRP